MVARGKIGVLIIIVAIGLLCVACGKNQEKDVHNTEKLHESETSESTETSENTEVSESTESSESTEVTENTEKENTKEVVYDTGDEELNTMCDYVLSDIVNEDMTEREKAYAVYTWVTTHIRYRGNSDMNDWVAGAKVALSTYKGNCYAFYSASRALLTRLGFETTEAVAIENAHYWNLVKVDGQWWHFDTTTGWGAERFLWTSEQINSYRYYVEAYDLYLEYEWDQKGIPE